jgi:hypothetical protein
MPYKLFLDFGASFTKAKGVSVAGVEIFAFRVETPNLKIDVDSGCKNYDPLDYSDKVVNLYKNIILDYGTPTDVAICGQVACYILINKDDKLLSDVISWQDISSEKIKYSIDISYPPISVGFFEDGQRPGLPLFSLIAYLSNKPEISNEKVIYYVPLTTFLLSKITRVSPLKIPIHISEAHATGMFSIHKNRWLTELLPDKLRNLVKLPLISELPVQLAARDSVVRFWSPIGDQQAAVNGSALSENEYLIHIATGGQVVCRLKTFPKDYMNRFQVRPEIYNRGFLATVTHLPAGRLFNRLFRNLSSMTQRSIDWNYIEKLELKDFQPFNYVFDLVSINNFHSDFPKWSELDHSIDTYLINFMDSFVDQYLNALKMLPSLGTDSYVFSGGLLTKSKIVQDMFRSKLPGNAKISVVPGDASLAGLSKMLESNLKTSNLISHGNLL